MRQQSARNGLPAMDVTRAAGMSQWGKQEVEATKKKSLRSVKRTISLAVKQKIAVSSFHNIGVTPNLVLNRVDIKASFLSANHGHVSSQSTTYDLVYRQRYNLIMLQ